MMTVSRPFSKKEISVLVLLAVVAGKLGWSVVRPFLHTPEAASKPCLAIEKDIRDWLTANNHCDTQEDCVPAALNCPFGCNTYVHKDINLSPMKEKIAHYNAECGFCVEECPSQPPACINHRCTTPSGL